MEGIKLLSELATKGVKLSVRGGELTCYAHPNSLTREIKDGIRKHKSEIIRILLKRGEGVELPGAAKSQGGNRFPLSVGQQTHYLLQKLSPLTSHVVPVCLQISPDVDVGRLQKAWEYTLDRYPILTARIVQEDDGSLFQQLDWRCRSKLLPRVTATDDERSFLAGLQQQIEIPFDLDNGPLTRIDLFCRTQRPWALLLVIHHIVFDVASAAVLVRSLFGFYEQLGRVTALDAVVPVAGYEQFVAWEERMLASEEGQAHALYWQQQLGGGLPPLITPSYPHQPGDTTEACRRTLTDDLCHWILDFCKSRALQPSVIFLAAFQLWLHKHSGQQDLALLMPAMIRPGEEFAEEVGYYFNTVPVRTRCTDDLSWEQYLRDVQATVFDALYHGVYPFALMRAGDQRLDRGTFRALYGYQDFIGTFPLQRELDLAPPKDFHPLVDADFDLTLEVDQREMGFDVLLRGSPERYSSAAVRAFAEQYLALLEDIRRHPADRIDTFAFASDLDRFRTLQVFNATEVAFEPVSSIPELFAAQVVRSPDAIAAVYGQESLSYQQLYERSRQLAQYLCAQGVAADQLVGVCLPRSLSVLVAVLGVMQAGAAYVPLDPEYPAERSSYMVRDSGARIVLTVSGLREKLAGLVPAGARLICLDELAPAPASGVMLPVRPDQLAYVIYTSGSTGQPKGVMIEHRSAVTLIQWAKQLYSAQELSGVLAATSVCFDLSVFEMFVPLAVGGTVILAGNVLELMKLDSPVPVSLINTVPSAIQELLRLDGIPASVQTVNLAGEPLEPALVDRIYASGSVGKVYDLYGPSEDTTYSTYMLRERHGRRSIGRPIANTQVHILDGQRNLLPIGVVGELYIGGAGLARGYLGKEELTRERFVENPFQAGSRLYRTGDLARWTEDGTLEYLGRIDTQVKVRGFRIETGEIEARLNQHAGVAESVVVAQGTGSEKRLVAFYRTLPAKPASIPNEELRAHLQASLPGYMVPAVFVSVPVIPLTPNGKVDRRSLERREVDAQSSHEYVAAQTALQRELIHIWSRVLKLSPQKIGIHADFLELGGHSLLATQLISRVRSQLQVELPLRAALESTVEQQAMLVGQLPHVLTHIAAIDRRQLSLVPLSYAQERLWFIAQLEPGSVGYDELLAVRLRGPLSVADLQSVVNQLIERHEALRTVFPSEDGRPSQLVQASVWIPLEQEDLRGLSAAIQSERIRLSCQNEGETRFDLARGPLLRGRVLQLAAEDHVLVLNLHHIICDGWSLGILVSELGALLRARRRGERVELPPLPIQYVDYSVWQREWLQGARLEKQLQYWRDKLQGMTGSLEIGSDYPRPVVQSFAGNSLAFEIGADLTQRLRQLGERAGGTLYMVLLSVFNVLLWKYSGQEDVCVGGPIANRQYGETEGLVGMFVNTLALRSRVDAQDTFVQLLEQVKRTCLEAYENQDAPFEKVVEAIKPQRDLGISPLFQVMLVLQNAQGEGSYLEGVELYELARRVSKFDLTLELTERSGGLSGVIEYSTSLYRPERIARLAEHFAGLCTAVVADADRPIGEIECLGSAERTQLVERFNATGKAFEPVSGIPALFAAQVERTPEAVAAVYGQERLSYQQLHERSQQLARYLCAQGVAADQLVGVCLPRSLSLLVAVLGVMQAGGAYVPLDPEYPAERSSYMVRDSGARIVLTVRALREKLAGLVPAGAQLICLDELELAPVSSALPPVQPDQLAYVIYTSGSTGQPKGVMIEHRSAVTLIQWAQQLYSAHELSGVLAATSVCFDLSVFEMFVPLAVGGTVILVNNVLELTQLDSPVPVSLINTVPSAMQELLELGALASSVRTVNLAGEPLEPALVDRIYASGPVGKVYDLYGPSEDTTYSTYMLRERHGRRSIGRPIANTQVYILDTQRQLQPLGVAGELYIGGAGLARGYLGKEELTRERFVENPFQAGSRLYRTGDLARWSEEGTLEYLGRIDTQVKIRGFRIETAEIEARLNQHAGVAESVVVAQGTGSEKRLVAFYRVREGQAKLADGTAIAAEELRAHLQTSLPGYMVPAVFVSVPVIPLTPNGKVDRRSLERREVSAESTRTYVAARTPLESELTLIWAQVLKLDPARIGIHDDFFELGGHSLLATQLVSRIRSRLRVELPLRVLFKHSSIAGQGQLVVQLPSSPLPRITPVERGERMPLSYAQERLWFIDQLEPGSAGYNVLTATRLQGSLSVDALQSALSQLIERHTALRTVFPSESGQPWQQIQSQRCVPLEQEDLRELNAEHQSERVRLACQSESEQRFDLASGPLLRGRILQLAAEDHVLVLNLHHIICDGWSLGILVSELTALLHARRRGERIELPPLPIQYVDYSVWQREWLLGARLEKQLQYWRDKLQGMTGSLEIGSDYPRPVVQSYAGSSHAFAIGSDLTQRLRQLSERAGGTLYMVLLSALNVLLWKYSGQEDVCVGSPIANRQYGETEGLIGMFVNTLALRTRVNAQDTFAQLLEQVKQTCLEAYENQDAPFEKVVDAVKPQRDLGISPLFQVMLVLQNAQGEGGYPEGVEPYELARRVSKFDLTLELTERGGGLECLIEYSTSLYRPERIARLAEHFAGLCTAVVADADRPIGEIECLGSAERTQLVERFNATGMQFEPVSGIPALFAAQVERTPEAVAAVYGQERLSYQELHERSQQLARYLFAQGVAADQLVGVCLPRSLSLLVAVLGVMQAGGAYVPLDPEYPAERSSYMVRDSGSRIVLTVRALREKLAGLVPAGAQLICLDELELAPVSSALPPVRPDQLAYVIYTSGSTGQPKGVMIEHRSAVTLIQWAKQLYSAQELSGVLAATSVCFDLSVFEMFVPLAVGGTVILVNNVLELTQLDSPVPVSLINTVPSAMQELLELGALASSVQTVNLAGEPLEPALVDRIYASGPVGKVYDLYGPSEDTTYSTYMLRERHGRRSIGRPIANTQVYILDTQRQLQPLGVAGELYIGGAGLARGYLGKEELTRGRFVGNPFQAGSRLYRTGDLARWSEEGTLEYLGRIDTQVKIRGFRIETAEIEARLNQHAGVAESVVVAQGTGSEKRLVAYYRMREGQAKLADGVAIAAEELRAHLQTSLPGYMVPAVFVSVPVIPLTPNGKVDRRSLERSEVSAESTRTYVAARTPLESELTRIWSQVLKLDPARIGIHDDFFELGGHSLLATQLVSRVRSRLRVELPLRELFQQGTIEQQAKLIGPMPHAAGPRIEPVDRGQLPAPPLSYAQERLWFIEQLSPGRARYNVPIAMRLQSSLWADDVEWALQRIVERHEVLRTVFPAEGGAPHQKVETAVSFPLKRVDLMALTPREQDARVKSLCAEEAQTGFDLAKGPLFRGILAQLAPRDHILVLNLHHIVCDGWSLAILTKELSQLLHAKRRRQPVELPTLPIQYVDYSVWQRRWLQDSGDLDRQLSYWTRQLQGLTGHLDIGSDRVRPAMQSFVGATHEFSLAPELTAGLRSLAASVGGTLYMVLLSLFKLLLWRYSAQEDICVGSPIANRRYAQIEGLIGMFVNTLALRSRVKGQDTFRQLLENVKRTCLEGYENQDVPFEKVVEAVKPQRDPGASPLFQMMLVLQNAPAARSGAQGLEPYALDRRISNFDLTLELTEQSDGGLQGVLEYSTALYHRDRIERVAEHFACACAAVAADPDQPVSDYELLGAHERQLLLEFNATQATYPQGSCVHELFARQVKRAPRAIAVEYETESLTYEALYERSRALALYLQSLGVGPDRIVGLCLDRAIHMQLAVFGTVQAGGAYLPLDPTHPDERLRYMLSDSDAPVVLTQEKYRPRLEGLLSTSCRVVSLDAPGTWEQDSARLSARGIRLSESVGPENLCYVIYTSGSTGQPKGVMIEHRALVNRLHWMQRCYALGERDVVLQKTPYGFDVSVWEFFWPMISGARLVFAAPEGHRDAQYLADLIRRANVTTLHFVPAMLESFLEAVEDECGSVRQLFCSGEALDRNAVERYRDAFPRARLHNLYGPTEAAIDVTAYECTRLSYPFVPIGAPIDNIQIYILDEKQRLQPIGIAGELYIAGDGLARGYLKQDALTRERFAPNPFRPGTRMYRTGDLARWLPDGNIEYLGRNDFQVKIRGMRIELGEIEARLNAHPQIATSVVLARDSDSGKQLVAYYRARGSQAGEATVIAVQDLRSQLQSVLPAHMVPAAFVSVASIPLSSNGKVDRRALECLEVTAETLETRAPLTTPVQQALAEIWSEVLKLPVEKIGMDSDFFELGGHSLLAVQLLAKITRRFQRRLPLSILFTAASIATLAKLLDTEPTAPTDPILVPIQRGGSRIPIFAVPGAGGNVLSLQPLSKALGTQQPFYGLQAVGLDGGTAPLSSVEQTARANITAMKSIQPQGPYRLLGHSYGGVIAYEMTRQLLEERQEVESLILLDSEAPDVMQARPTKDPLTTLVEACTTVARANGIDCHLDDERLRQLPEAEHRDSVLGALNEQGLHIDPQQFATFHGVFTANLSCYRSYRPVPLPRRIDTTLYRAMHTCRATPDLPEDHGWSSVFSEPIKIHDIEADHYSMLDSQHAPLIASRVVAAHQQPGYAS